MRKVLLTIAASILAAGSASAADIAARPYTKAPVIAPAYNWTGFYIGGQIGGQWSKLGLADPRLGPLTYDPKSDGFAGGVFGGYQQQWGQFVLGIEGSYIAAASDSNAFATPSVNIFSLGGTGVASTKLKDIWSIGGRAGWAFDNWLPYITGGYAEGQYGFNAQTTPAGLAQDVSPRFSGAYIGGGLEWAPLNSNWIVGVEYRHYILDAKTISVTSTDGTFVEQIDFKPKADTVMARLSYKFNWGAPLVAKY